MRFLYHPYPVRGTGSSRYKIVHRPTILVRVVGASGGDEIMGLVDTGADDTLLPDFLIKPLGVTIDPADKAIVVGIDGGTFVVRYGELDLELPGYGWSARVGFHASFNAVLGHAGFLEYFTATFNGRRCYLNLTPNGTARTSDGP